LRDFGLALIGSFNSGSNFVARRRFASKPFSFVIGKITRAGDEMLRSVTSCKLPAPTR
jgi:hypothetical protein